MGTNPKSVSVGARENKKDAMSFRQVYPQSLEEHETNYLPEDAKRRVLGVGLSGGGIRSATFCLGVFQAFASRKGLLGRISYLSTVSGGGYFGTFLGCIFARRKPEPGVNPSENAEKILRQEIHPGIVGHLRDSGNYLAPSGRRDYAKIAAVYLRNLLTINFIMLAAVLSVFFFAELVDLLAAQREESAFFQRYGSGEVFLFSYWLLAPVLVFFLFFIPLLIDYWLVRAPEDLKYPRYCLGGMYLAGVAICLIVDSIPEPKMPLSFLRNCSHPFLLYSSLIALVSILIYWFINRTGYRDSYRRRIAREKLEDLQAWSLRIILILAIFGIIQSLGQTLYQIKASHVKFSLGIGGGVLALLLSGKAESIYQSILGSNSKIFGFFSKISLLKVFGVVLPLLWLLSAAVLMNAVVWRFSGPAESPAVLKETLKYIPVFSVTAPELAAFLGFLSALLISLFIGKDIKFINLCSLNSFYRNRLEQTYQKAGASPEGPAVMMKLQEYFRPERGPVHLLNVTVNETIDGATRSISRDRNGIGMSVGPCGISLGVKHHLAFRGWKEDEISSTKQVFPEEGAEYRVFQRLEASENWTPESLGISAWASISGAAVAPGMGRCGDCFKSMVLTLGNIRLGYWWNSNVYPPAAPDEEAGWRMRLHRWHTALSRCAGNAFEIQRKIWAEFSCSFKGTAEPLWYLSDGGHFENLGGYELIRRRLPLIVIVDAEQDAEFQFGGLSSLVRKARMDFGAEIAFFDRETLENPASIDPGRIPEEYLPRLVREEGLCGIFGGLESLKPQASRADGRHAALGSIVYGSTEGPRSSLLIYLKASMTGDEPLDLLSYKAAEPSFPHQSTQDQFFDEAQWESYRKLGEHAGTALAEFIWRLTSEDKPILNRTGEI